MRPHLSRQQERCVSAMRKALAIALVSTFLVASVSLAATGGTKPRTSSLTRAVRGTEAASSFRYSMVITVVRRKNPVNVVQVHGVSARGQLFVRVRQAKVVLADGTPVPGPEAVALIDGPFLYERAPAG